MCNSRVIPRAPGRVEWRLPGMGKTKEGSETVLVGVGVEFRSLDFTEWFEIPISYSRQAAGLSIYLPTYLSSLSVCIHLFLYLICIQTF